MLNNLPIYIAVLSIMAVPLVLSGPATAGEQIKSQAFHIVQNDVAQNDVDGAYVDTDDDNKMEGTILDIDGDDEMEYEALQRQERPGQIGEPSYADTEDDIVNGTPAPEQNTPRAVPLQQDVTPSPVYDPSPDTVDNEINIIIEEDDDDIETNIDEFEDDEFDDDEREDDGFEDYEVDEVTIDLDDPVTVID